MAFFPNFIYNPDEFLLFRVILTVGKAGLSWHFRRYWFHPPNMAVKQATKEKAVELQYNTKQSKLVLMEKAFH